MPFLSWSRHTCIAILCGFQLIGIMLGEGGSLFVEGTVFDCMLKDIAPSVIPYQTQETVNISVVFTAG